MTHILAIDYGLRFIGLSVASTTLKIPIPLKELDRKKMHDEEIVKQILAQMEERGSLCRIVIGLAKHMDNNASILSQAAKKFGACFKDKTEASIVFLDERLTSKMAHTMLKERQMSRFNRSKVINSLSATILLQNYLDANF